MDEAFTASDVADAHAQVAGPRVLARLPRVTVGADAPQAIQRVDSAEGQNAAVVRKPTEQSPASQSPVEGAAVAVTAEPIATIRIDTLSGPAGWVDVGKLSRHDPPHTADGGPRASANQRVEEDWLVRLEAMIAPHAQWIVLAAVVAALGLTLALLQSGEQQPIPRTPLPEGLAVDPGPTEGLAAAVAATETIVIEQVTADASDRPAETRPPVAATGPIGIAAATGPRAQLVNNVLPIDAGEQTASEKATPSPIAHPSDGVYPRTAASVPWWAEGPEGANRR